MKLNRLVWICAIINLLSACQKTEFMPEPIGESIEAPPYPSFLEVLPEGASLFQQAWNKAEMENLLAVEQAQAKLTFLVPNNTAMERAGFNTAKIQSSSKEELRYILRYHVLNGSVSKEQIDNAGGALSFPTLLRHEKFLDAERQGGSQMRTVPYQYKHELNADNGILLIDGKSVDIDDERLVAQGQVFVIDHFLHVPEKQMYEFLAEDNRFSLYLKAIAISLPEYKSDFENYMFVYYPVPMRFILDWDYHFEGTFHSSEDFPRHVIRGTLFAPTDQAFHELGIYTEADLRALNNRVERGDFYSFGEGERTPVDSLLQYHFLGNAYTEFGYTPDWTLYSFVVQAIWNSAFFSQTLNNRLLAAFPGVLHRFDRSGDRIKVSHQSSTSSATIIEDNVNTIQGPVHVVDRIIVPEGFSMWHKK